MDMTLKLAAVTYRACPTIQILLRTVDSLSGVLERIILMAYQRGSLIRSEKKHFEIILFAWWDQRFLTQICELKLGSLFPRGERANILEAVVHVRHPEPVDLGARVEVPREHYRIGRRRHHGQLGRHNL